MKITLLSDSCTTGWAHWGHGELWLTSDSIVRIGKRSLTIASARRGITGGAVGGLAHEVLRGRTFAGHPVDVDRAEWERYVGGFRNTLVIDLGDVVRASLRVGLMSSRLSIVTRSGRRVKLLWMRNPTAVAELRSALPPS